MKEEKFPNSRKPSHRPVCGEFWSLRAQHNQEKKKKKHRLQAATASGEVVAQMPAVPTSEQRLDREAQAA